MNKIALNPFFASPLESLREYVRPMSLAVRTLPDAQLASELEQLAEICAEPGASYAENLLRGIYEAEIARRSVPDQSFDDDLDRALTWLERQTNEADRHLVHEIGHKIFQIGGKEAMLRAYSRMLDMARPASRELRDRILRKRWAGIAP